MYTTQQFADKYGFNVEFVRQMCRGHIDSRSRRKSTLPPYWRAKKVGRDWLLFKIKKRV